MYKVLELSSTDTEEQLNLLAETYIVDIISQSAMPEQSSHYNVVVVVTTLRLLPKS